MQGAALLLIYALSEEKKVGKKWQILPVTNVFADYFFLLKIIFTDH